MAIGDQDRYLLRHRLGRLPKDKKKHIRRVCCPWEPPHQVAVVHANFRIPELKAIGILRVVKAGGVTLGYQALLRDLGLTLGTRVWTDRTATLGICGRQGLGRLIHIDTQCVWIQQRVRDKSIELLQV